MFTINDAELEPMFTRLIASQRCAIQQENTSAEESPILSVDEAAKYLQVSKPTIARWMRDGVIPRSKVRGRVLIQRKDLDALLSRNQLRRYQHRN